MDDRSKTMIDVIKTASDGDREILVMFTAPEVNLLRAFLEGCVGGLDDQDKDLIPLFQSFCSRFSDALMQSSMRH